MLAESLYICQYSVTVVCVLMHFLVYEQTNQVQTNQVYYASTSIGLGGAL